MGINKKLGPPTGNVSGCCRCFCWPYSQWSSWIKVKRGEGGFNGY